MDIVSFQTFLIWKLSKILPKSTSLGKFRSQLIHLLMVGTQVTWMRDLLNKLAFLEIKLKKVSVSRKLLTRISVVWMSRTARENPDLERSLCWVFQKEKIMFASFKCFKKTFFCFILNNFITGPLSRSWGLGETSISATSHQAGEWTRSFTFAVDLGVA